MSSRAPAASFIHPTWTSAAKEGAGTALHGPRVWFTVAEGMLTECYYPRIDIPQIKELNFIVADDQGFWVDLRHTDHYSLTEASLGVPALTIVHHHERFRLTLRLCADPNRDAVLCQVHLEGDDALAPYALLTARIGENATDNLAWVERHGAFAALCAAHGPFGLAMVAADAHGQDALLHTSVGFVGESDLWQDFARHGRMTWQYDEAGPGYMALGARLPRQANMSLAFATSAESAATLAISAVHQPFNNAWNAYLHQWRVFLADVVPPEDMATELWPLVLRSASVLKTLKDRTFPGAMVASLSTPWGPAVTHRGGYHLVWSRDLVESAGAFFALSLSGDAREVLRYLIATQQEDGHWHQNQWLGGRSYWRGIQLDETAFPVVLAGKLAEHHALQGTPVQPMVSRALRFLIREGPVTNQDRWEECRGLNAFTAAVMIAALVEGAAFLDEAEADFALSLADEWCHDLDGWLFAEHTSLSKACGVPGHYVRMAPAGALDDRTALTEPMLIKNRSDGASPPACEQVALDFLQLVRFGLRRPDDPCIVASVAVADRFLRVETPSGPCWYRYTGDGYGEKDDGSPFDGTGCGRPWPLLTGERGHYALCCGEDVTPYLQAMAAMTGTGGLLPEQIWDGQPLPGHHLEPGKPTGSAMPLTWAHAEFVKLAYSQALGVPVDRPAATAARYRHGVPLPRQLTWTMWQPRHTIPQGRMLRIVLDRPALVHWGSNGWQQTQDIPTISAGRLGHVVCLPCAGLAIGETIQFTWRWSDSGAWVQHDHHLRVVTPWSPEGMVMRAPGNLDASPEALRSVRQS